MTKKYDIIIIGAGSGGLNVASFMNKVGFNVLLIDKTDHNIGGDCLNFGCVPSKALIHIARVIKVAKSSEEFGVTSSGSVDFKKIKSYIKDKQNIIRQHENTSYLKNLGLDVILGEASFKDKNTVQVGDQIYVSKKIVVATGSSPRKLEAGDINKEKIVTNETIFDIDKLPEKFIIFGGGPIGIELGQAFSFLGSKVTIIQRGDKILNKEDPEIINLFEYKLIKDGLEIIYDYEFDSLQDNRVIIKDKNNNTKSLEYDLILSSIGRVPNTKSLNLEKAGIETDKGGHIKVNKYLQTTNKKVYAIGDVIGGLQFTHAAELHAGLIIRNFFSPFKKKINTDNFAWVTYTSPEIATFGLSPQKLNKRKIKYKTLETSFKDNDRSITDNNQEGKLKIYIKNNKILGGTMMADNAGELIQELILANFAKLNINKLFSKTYPYPTATRINKSLISKYMSKKLNPLTKSILKLMYH